MARLRDLDLRDSVKLTLVVVDETTGATVADAFSGGEDSTLTVRAAAALFRAIADDLDPPAPPAPARRR